MKSKETLMSIKDGTSKDFVRALYYCREVKELKKENLHLNKIIKVYEAEERILNKEINELKNVISSDNNKIIIIKYKNIVKGMEGKIVKYKKFIKELKETNHKLLENGKDTL